MAVSSRNIQEKITDVLRDNPDGCPLGYLEMRVGTKDASMFQEALNSLKERGVIAYGAHGVVLKHFDDSAPFSEGTVPQQRGASIRQRPSVEPKQLIPLCDESPLHMLELPEPTYKRLLNMGIDSVGDLVAVLSSESSSSGYSAKDRRALLDSRAVLSRSACTVSFLRARYYLNALGFSSSKELFFNAFGALCRLIAVPLGHYSQQSSQAGEAVPPALRFSLDALLSSWGLSCTDERTEALGAALIERMRRGAKHQLTVDDLDPDQIAYVLRDWMGFEQLEYSCEARAFAWHESCAIGYRREGKTPRPFRIAPTPYWESTVKHACEDFGGDVSVSSDNKILRFVPRSLDSWVNTIFDTTRRVAIMSVLNGKTLTGIQNIVGVSIEELRVIIRDEFSHAPVLAEDMLLKYVGETFPRYQEFHALTNADERTYRYLFLRFSQSNLLLLPNKAEGEMGKLPSEALRHSHKEPASIETCPSASAAEHTMVKPREGNDMQSQMPFSAGPDGRRPYLSEGTRRMDAVAFSGKKEMSPEEQRREQRRAARTAARENAREQQSQRFKQGCRNMDDSRHDSIAARGAKPTEHASGDSIAYFATENGLVPRSRDAVIAHIMRTQNDAITVSELAQKYLDFLQAHNASTTERYLALPKMRNFVMMLQRASNVLMTRQKYIRYYDWKSVDFTLLDSALLRMVQENIECSIALLVRRYPGIMQSVGARDEDELYAIAKERCSARQHGCHSLRIRNVEFPKVPIIQFGNADRNAQLRELIKVMAPVRANELAVEYEHKYGVKAATVKSSFLRECRQYYIDGRYEYVDESFTDEEASFLIDALKGKSYISLGYMRERFSGAFSQSSAHKLNETNLNPLGLSISEKLIVRVGINLEGIFARLIDSQSKFSSGDDGFPQEVVEHSSFRAELKRRLYDLSLIEYQENSFVTGDYLRSRYGVSTGDLRAYVGAALAHVGDGVPFTIHSLYGDGFSHRVDVLGEMGEFDEGILNAILAQGCNRNQVHSTSLAHVTVLCKSPESLTSAKFIRWVIGSEGEMDLEDLADHLEVKYGIEMQVPVLRQAVERADLFIATALDDMVFLDREAYRAYVVSVLGA